MLRRSDRGFTLLEVMVGLALLGLALVVLMKSAAGSIFNAEQAHMTGVVTDLARAKMYDIEEVLLKDGFTDTSQSHESEECFTDEGWPNVCYSYKVEEPKLPSFEELTSMAQGKAKDDATKALGSAGSAGSAILSQLGSGDLGSAGGGFGDSMLGGMLGMFGASSGVDAAAGASMIQSQYSMFQEVLKVSVRKVTLSVTWTVLGSKRDMKVVAFFTDPTAMNKTLLGQASGALEASGGSGSGSGSGSSTTPTTRPPSRGGGGGK
jgi:prepilin-type N-terminal cleavage/methylation domain-containing protein